MMNSVPEVFTLDKKKRCAWAESPGMFEYHDQEWGVPQHDDPHCAE